MTLEVQTPVAQGQTDRPAELREPVDLPANQTTTTPDRPVQDGETDIEQHTPDEAQWADAAAEKAEEPTFAAVKPMKMVVAQSTRRQNAERNLSAASKVLTEVLTKSSSTTTNVPQNIVHPQHTTEDIVTIANMIGSAIDSWQKAPFETNETRSQFKETAMKWFKFPCSYTIPALKGKVIARFG